MWKKHFGSLCAAILSQFLHCSGNCTWWYHFLFQFNDRIFGCTFWRYDHPQCSAFPENINNGCSEKRTGACSHSNYWWDLLDKQLNILTGRHNVPYEGVSILFCSDLHQLQQICEPDKVPYTCSPRALAWEKSVNCVIFLRTATALRMIQSIAKFWQECGWFKTPT